MREQFDTRLERRGLRLWWVAISHRQRIEIGPFWFKRTALKVKDDPAYKALFADRAGESRREQMNIDITKPVPSPLWLVHSPDRPSSYLGKVYADKQDALRARGENDVVVELRLAPTVTAPTK